MKKTSILLAILTISFSNFAFSFTSQKEQNTLQEIQKLEEHFHCVNVQHSKYSKALSSLYDEYEKRIAEINNNPKFLNQLKKYNKQRKEAIIDNEYFLAEAFLNIRLQYIAEVATCVAKSKDLNLDAIVDEKLNKKGFTNKKGTI